MANDRWIGVGAREVRREGRLAFEGEEIEGVNAEISLPERDSGEIRAIFRWPSKGFGLKPYVGFATFESKLRREDGSVFESLTLSGLHVSHATTEHIAPDVAVIRGEGDARNLFCIRQGKAPGAGAKATISAVLTPNPMLQPFAMDRVSLNGSITADQKAHKIKVRAPGLGQVTFEHRYEWDSSVDHRVRFSRRYLCAEWKASASRVTNETTLKGSLKPLDDLVLLAGFASRTPTRCVGCMVTGSDLWAELFRRDVHIFSGRQRYKTKVNGGLVELGDFAQFLSHASAAFERCKFKDEVRHALFALENRADNTIEQGFVDLFSAFEGLLEALVAEATRDRFKKDAALRRKTRNRLLNALEEWLQAGEISEEIRNQFARQIGNLQSVSFAEKYRTLKKVVRNYADDDLWPMIATGDTVSLYVVRNRLSHGAVVPEDQIDAVWDASHHLEWLLERLIIAILEWPLEETDLSPNGVRSYWRPELTEWQASANSLQKKPLIDKSG